MINLQPVISVVISYVSFSLPLLGQFTVDCLRSLKGIIGGDSGIEPPGRYYSQSVFRIISKWACGIILDQV